MKNQNKVILKNGLEITGATLLTAEEAEKLPKKTLSIGCWWWLRSPGDDSYDAAGVLSDGSVFYGGNNVNYSCGAVRPALMINLESLNLDIGDQFDFGGRKFEIISGTRALCTKIIGYCAFRKDWPADNTNDYATSTVKRVVDNWYQFSVFSCFPDRLFHNHRMAENLRKMYELSVAVLNEAEDISSYSDYEKELLGECADVRYLYEKIMGL